MKSSIGLLQLNANGVLNIIRWVRSSTGRAEAGTVQLHETRMLQPPTAAFAKDEMENRAMDQFLAHRTGPRVEIGG